MTFTTLRTPNAAQISSGTKRQTTKNVRKLNLILFGLLDFEISWGTVESALKIRFMNFLGYFNVTVAPGGFFYMAQQFRREATLIK